MLRSISSRIERWAEQTPDALALTAWRESTTERLTYADLLVRVWSLQSLLGDLPAGYPTMLVMQPAPSAVAALLALCALERAIVLVPPTLSPGEWGRVLEAARPASIIHTGAPAPLSLEPSSVGEVALPFGLSCTHLAPSATDGPIPGALIQMTSGSTGTSRLAVRSFAAVSAEIDAVATPLGLDGGTRSRVLCASALSHSYGCVAGLLVPLTYGSQTILPAGAEALLHALLVEQPAILVGLESTYRRLLEEPRAPESLRRVRFALSAGAPLPPKLYDRCVRTLGVSVRQDYGTTETGTISIDAADPPNPDTVGFPLAHVSIRLAVPEDQPLREGEEGEVLVRSHAVAHAYLENGSQVPATDPDGWYHTRDTGHLGPDGSLSIGRRLRPLIDRGKNRVRPDDIEEVIGRMPGVREVVVVGQQRPRNTDGIKAIVATSSVTRDALEEWCRRYLPSEQIPDAIEIRDELQRSPAGKVLQKYLVDAVGGSRKEG